MPTPEEIKSIAHEYAKEILSKQPMKAHAIPEIWEKAVADTEKPLAELFEPLITFLSKDYCIVPKSKVKEIINQNQVYKDYDFLWTRSPESLIPERTDWNEMNRYADGLYFLIDNIISLFGSSLFNEE